MNTDKLFVIQLHFCECPVSFFQFSPATTGWHIPPSSSNMSADGLYETHMCCFCGKLDAHNVNMTTTSQIDLKLLVTKYSSCESACQFGMQDMHSANKYVSMANGKTTSSDRDIASSQVRTQNQGCILC